VALSARRHDDHSRIRSTPMDVSVSRSRCARCAIRDEERICPLSLLRLAQVYGPWVLTLKIATMCRAWTRNGDGCASSMRANMAPASAAWRQHNNPSNDIFDGLPGRRLHAWYTAGSRCEKIRQSRNLHAYREPGTVMRYRDQDYYIWARRSTDSGSPVRGPQPTCGIRETEVVQAHRHTRGARGQDERGGRPRRPGLATPGTTRPSTIWPNRLAVPGPRRARRRTNSQSRK